MIGTRQSLAILTATFLAAGSTVAFAQAGGGGAGSGTGSAGMSGGTSGSSGTGATGIGGSLNNPNTNVSPHPCGPTASNGTGVTKGTNATTGASSSGGASTSIDARSPSSSANPMMGSGTGASGIVGKGAATSDTASGGPSGTVGGGC